MTGQDKVRRVMAPGLPDCIRRLDALAARLAVSPWVCDQKEEKKLELNTFKKSPQLVLLMFLSNV